MKRNFDAIGLDIGGTNLRIGRVDRDYSARDIEISSSREIFSNEDSVSRISAIISTIFQLISAIGSRRSSQSDCRQSLIKIAASSFQRRTFPD